MASELDVWQQVAQVLLSLHHRDVMQQSARRENDLPYDRVSEFILDNPGLKRDSKTFG